MASVPAAHIKPFQVSSMLDTTFDQSMKGPRRGEIDMSTRGFGEGSFESRGIISRTTDMKA
jgi:hypothetical protein